MAPSTPRPVAAPLYVVALAAALLVAPHTPVYWDSFGYVLQAVTGQVGGLGLGRPVFIGVSHALARVWFDLGGSPWDLERLLRLFWTMVACAAAPLTWRVALECGLSRRASVLAGAAVACSPAMAHTSGTLLTDGPAVAVFLLAFLLAARAAHHDDARRHRAVLLAGAAGATLGVAIGIREGLLLGAFSLPLVLAAAPRTDRWRLLAAMAGGGVIATVVPIAIVLARDPAYFAMVRGWFAGLARDRTALLSGGSRIATFIGWLLVLGPVVAPGAVIAHMRWPNRIWRPGSVLFAGVAPSAAQLAWTATYPAVGYSPRYLVAAFPFALAIPAALAFDRWAGRSRGRAAWIAAALVVPVVVAVPIVRVRAAPREETIRAWPARLQTVPADSLIVTGQLCPAIPLVRELIAREGRGPAPAWEPVCPGWAWPTDVSARLDAALASGRPVVLDLRPESWWGAEQQAARQQAQTYRRTHAEAERRGRLIVWE